MKVFTKVFATVILTTVMSAGAFAQSKIIAVVKKLVGAVSAKQ